MHPAGMYSIDYLGFLHFLTGSTGPRFLQIKIKMIVLCHLSLLSLIELNLFYSMRVAQLAKLMFFKAFFHNVIV